MFPNDDQNEEAPYLQGHKAPTPKEDPIKPMPVVKVLSTHGLEYAMMTISLWLTAFALGWIFLNLINGSRGYDNLVVPISALITGVPIFGLFFIRLHLAEMRNPALRLEASRRRWTQLTQMVAFLACLINVGVFIYAVMKHFGSEPTPSLGKAAGDLAIVLVIAGGILSYYWREEHRQARP